MHTSSVGLTRQVVTVARLAFRAEQVSSSHFPDMTAGNEFSVL